MLRLIEPFPAYMWPLAFEWYTLHRRMVADDFAPKTLEQFAEFSTQQYPRTFGLEADGRLGGLVAVEAINPVTWLAHTLAARWFGAERVKEGMLLAAGRLFETSPAIKIMGLAPERNRPIVALWVAAGARVEGVLRSHTLQNGRPVNAVAVGMTREEFYGLQSRRNVELVAVERDDEPSEHLHAGTAGPDGTTGDVLPGTGSEPVVGDAQPGRAGAEDAERQHDQPELLLARRPDEPVSLQPRVREKRSRGENAAPKRTGTARRPRRKRE